MNLSEFYKKFQMALIAAKNSEQDFVSIFKSNQRYTQLIEKIMKNDISYDYDDNYYPEFFRIDHTWWESQEESQIKDVNIYNWTFNIAIEHENNSCDWTYEVAKLDSVIVPLRVVIGYMDVNSRDSELDIVEAQRRNLKNMKMFPKEYEFGIILINNTLDMDKEDPFDMRVYLLSDSQTKRIN